MLISLLLFAAAVSGQVQKVDSIRFFTDEGLVQASLSTDLKQLQNESKQDFFQPASISFTFPDSTSYQEQISIRKYSAFICYETNSFFFY